MKAWGMACTLFLLAWVLGVVLEARLASIRGAAGQGDLLDRVLGQGRLALSVQFLEHADLYYHGGVETDTDCLEEESTPGEEAADSATGHHHDADTAEGATATRSDWWSRLNAQVHPSGHEHLKGVRYEKEILPWVWAAVKADPHNIRAYEIAGYWLGKRLSQPAEALRLLKDGKAKNTGAYALDVAIGDLYREVLKKDAEAYAAYLDAERNWRRRAVTDKADDKDARLTGAWILAQLAILDEKGGRLESALARYREALSLTVHPEYLAQRVATLEATIARQKAPQTPAPDTPAPP